MNKKVKIKGLDCPNCAKALEGEINKLPSVKSASLDFMKSQISFDADDVDVALDDIIKLTKQLEPGAKIFGSSQKNQISSNKASRWGVLVDVICFVFGLAIGVCTLVISLPVAAFWSMFVVSVLLIGFRTYYKAFRLLCKGVINENLLITISVIGASAIGETMEGLMVITLYTIGKFFEGLAVEKSRNSIAKLTNLKPDYAVVVDENGEHKENPENVLQGAIIIVRPGEKVAIDGDVVDGQSSLDTQSLTGESVPVLCKKGDSVLSGSIVLDGVIKVKTTSVYENSTVSKIMDLIEHASEKKSKTETVISKITRWYTLGVIVVALLVFGIFWAVTSDFNTALYRGLIFLVVSCPCAFAISVPLSYFSGLGNASKKGILIKGSNYLDACAGVKRVFFDKTGTLTTGNFQIERVEVLSEKLTEREIVQIASLGEQYSLHPLAKAIVEANTLPLDEVSSFNEIAGEGVSFVHKKKKYFVGRKSADVKNTAVEVYQNDELLGVIYLRDSVKENSFDAIAELKKMGIKTMLLSGDKKDSVEETAKQLGVEEFQSELLPQEKFEFIEKNRVGTCYVGDGINDAPSLMVADVGVSMGINGSTASVEASDVVLVDDDPKKVATAIKLSKYTRKIVWENICLSALIKVTFLALGVAGVTGMFAAVIADVGVTLLAIFNSLRALWKK